MGQKTSYKKETILKEKLIRNNKRVIFYLYLLFTKRRSAELSGGTQQMTERI